MADFIPYQEAQPRTKSADGFVMLAPDRWQALCEHVQLGSDMLYELENVDLRVPVQVGEILFLPAMYRAA